MRPQDLLRTSNRALATLTLIVLFTTAAFCATPKRVCSTISEAAATARLLTLA